MTSTPRSTDFRFTFEYCVRGALQPCRPVPLKTSTRVGAVDIGDTGDWVSFHCGETDKEPERRIYLWWMGDEPGVYHEKIFKLPCTAWDSEWHHVVAVCERGKAGIWFDGDELELALQDRRHFCKDVEFADFGLPDNVAVKHIETEIHPRPEPEPENTVGGIVEPRKRELMFCSPVNCGIDWKLPPKDENREFQRLYINESATLPVREGHANQILKVAADGTLSWVDPKDRKDPEEEHRKQMNDRKAQAIAEVISTPEGRAAMMDWTRVSEYQVDRRLLMVEELPQGALGYYNHGEMELVDISLVSDPDPLYRLRDDEVTVSELMMQDL